VLVTKDLDPGDKIVALRQRGAAALGLHKIGDAVSPGTMCA